MYGLDSFGWVIAGLCAFIIGISKTGIPGVNILFVPLLAQILPARQSTGIVLPMLILGDIFAIFYYHKEAVWSHLIKLIPWTVMGILIGYFALSRVNDQQLRPIIGGIVLLMLFLNYWRERGENVPIPTQWWFAAGMGITAGITTMMANAAGPVMVIFLLAMRLPKIEFISTGAWFFFMVNLFKVPFSYHLGLINMQSLQFNAFLFPFVALGALSGVKILHYIPQKAFAIIVQVLAVFAAIMLFY